MKASIHITAMMIDGNEEGTKINFPVVIVSNDRYEDDQEQQKEEKLPITEELIFMKYSDGAEENEDDGNFHAREIKHGYVFFYPSMSLCKIIECSVTSQKVAEELAAFEDWVCKVLFLTNEEIPLRNSTNKHILAKQHAATAKYCIETNLAILLRTQDLNQIFSGKSEIISDTSSLTEESKDQNLSVRKQKCKR
jgi:hypothetical protein